MLENSNTVLGFLLLLTWLSVSCDVSKKDFCPLKELNYVLLHARQLLGDVFREDNA